MSFESFIKSYKPFYEINQEINDSFDSLGEKNIGTILIR